MPLARLRGPGHPDMLCDAMAIALVEEHLRRDPEARLRLSVTAGRQNVFVDGDVVSVADFDPAPVLRAVLAEVDPTLAAEPFLTCDAVEGNFLPPASSFEPWLVYGYANAETPDGLPLARHAAQAYVHAFERLRTTHEDGYVFGPDYDLLADDAHRAFSLRVERPAAADPALVLRLATGLLPEVAPDWTIRLLPSGSTTEAGLRRRSGASGHSGAVDSGSSHIPATDSGAGYALRHPSNLGQWLARAAAKRLVAEGAGRGVLAVLRWDPFETRPLIVSVRNEKGDDLASRLYPQAFDLAAPHPGFVEPGSLMKVFRSSWKKEGALPWEGAAD